MENYLLEEDVKVFCVPATSFPGGIKDAFEQLKNLHPSIIDRDLFGISHQSPEGTIIYKAAAQETFEGEGKKYNCETIILKKGEYLTETIRDWCKNETIIGSTFKKLLKDPKLDLTGFCVEWYKSKNEVICMVRLSNNFINYKN